MHLRLALISGLYTFFGGRGGSGYRFRVLGVSLIDTHIYNHVQTNTCERVPLFVLFCERDDKMASLASSSAESLSLGVEGKRYKVNRGDRRSCWRV